MFVESPSTQDHKASGISEGSAIVNTVHTHNGEDSGSHNFDRWSQVLQIKLSFCRQLRSCRQLPKRGGTEACVDEVDASTILESRVSKKGWMSVQ